MRIGTRFVIGNLVVFSLAFSLFLYWLTNDIEPEYRKAAEEPMVDASIVLASLASSTVKAGRVDTGLFESAFRQASAIQLDARIYDYVKNTVDFRVYITDGHGIVVFDSHSPENTGKDFSFWRDVELTLAGRYGARTTRDNPSDPTSGVMYVASPIVSEGRITGVLSVGKPTHPSNHFVASSKRKIIAGGIAACLLIIVMSYALSLKVVKPISMLTEYARAVRDGRRESLPSLGKDETAVLGAAFEEMREALEGKKYVEGYLQAFTHKVKAPLSAIKGAL